MSSAHRKQVMIIAGEASGDMHAAHVVRRLRKMHGDLIVFGVGGKAMKAAGAQILMDCDQLAVVGITEALTMLPRLFRAMRMLKSELEQRRPDLLILVDFPDFNLHLAAAAKKLSIPVLYYISPQIWAWRSGRINKIKARVDHMAVILPFEKNLYEKHHVPVSFVGHPLMDAIDENSFSMIDLHEKPTPCVGLLPGSRDREVNRLLPVMLAAARLLQQKLGDIEFIVSCAPSIDPEHLRSLINQAGMNKIAVTAEPVSKVFKRCRLVLAASGTVTLEAAIYRTPVVIVYTVSPLSYLMGRCLIRVDHIGLVNLIARKRIAPELIQSEVNPENIMKAALPVLTDSLVHARMCEELSIVREQLGAAGASDRVARIASRLMERSHAV